MKPPETADGRRHLRRSAPHAPYAAEMVDGARTYWTEGEEAALVAAVREHQGKPAMWANIKADSTFAVSLHRRSARDLAHKARTLARLAQGADTARQAKCAWTRDETEALRAGVRAHGAGSWKSIKEDPRFAAALSRRRPMQLKDKYRVLAAAGVREHAKDAGLRGPVDSGSQGGDHAACAARHNSLTLPTEVMDTSVSRALRYLGNVRPLVDYAGGETLSTTSTREWLQRNPAHCPVPVHSLHRFEIDHVISRQMGGHDHPYNYFLLEAGANASFRHWYSREKHKAVGDQVFASASAFARHCTSVASTAVNYNSFRPPTPPPTADAVPTLGPPSAGWLVAWRVVRSVLARLAVFATRLILG